MNRGNHNVRKRDFETFDRDKLDVNEEIQGETVEDRSTTRLTRLMISF